MTEQAALRFYREWSIARLGQTWIDFREWALPLVVIRGKGRGHLPESDHNRAPQFLDWHTAFHGSNWDAKAADMTDRTLSDMHHEAAPGTPFATLGPVTVERPCAGLRSLSRPVASEGPVGAKPAGPFAL